MRHALYVISYACSFVLINSGCKCSRVQLFSVLFTVRNDILFTVLTMRCVKEYINVL